MAIMSQGSFEWTYRVPVLCMQYNMVVRAEEGWLGEGGDLSDFACACNKADAQ